ncbi:MFS transporter [Leptolyngbya cf. ectocarpi LEGE 11479]|uniref:MFS transporter n=1 Tax=Leptolyngbya cf. ectocarpi LEGE 11479 TaxID=1828722 RepID=A0A928ZUT4_LEPEC|nr:MFS transporter [Leptolyngbya ectocarpi]MBE9067858.1 MFS transporter [Leptolyngbya cf. ectocarpi LEGE 11479]
MAAKLRLPLQFWIVTLVAFINSVSFTIIIPTLYPYAKEFGLSDLAASLLTTAFSLSQFFGTPILGRLSDRIGRKPLLVMSLLGTVVANILAAVSPFAWWLYLARMLDGLTGGNNSVAQAVVSDITTPEQRTQAFGIFGGMFRLGFVVGPPLAYFAQTLPPLPGVTPLGMSFMISAVMALVAAVFCFTLLPETRPPSECDSKLKLSFADFGFGRLATSFRKPVVGRIFLMTFLNGATFTVFTFAFQPFFLTVLEQDTKNLAFAFVFFGILAFLSQVFLLEPLRKKVNLVTLLVIALVMRGILLILYPSFPTIEAFWILLFFFGIVNAFPMPLIDSLLSLRTSKDEQGEALGTNSSYLSMSNAIGPAISGVLVTFGYGIPFFVAGGLTIAIATFAFSLKSSDKAPAA